MGAIEGLELDKKELERLLGLTDRPNVISALKKQLETCESELKNAQRNAEQSQPKKIETAEPKETSETADTAQSDIKKTVTQTVSGPTAAPGLVWTEVTSYEMKKGSGFNDSQVVIDLRLKGVEALPAENITCDFTYMSMDLKVAGLEGKNYRFRRTALVHDIVAAQSSYLVKKNHVIITMQKVKNEGDMMGYETWHDLIGRRKREDQKKDGAKKDPSSSLMGMMKDMYEEGDDSTRRIIGEAMSKAYQPGGPKMDDMKSFGGMDEYMGKGMNDLDF